MSTFVDIYMQMVDDFKTNHNKQNLIRIMTEYCSRDTTQPQDIYNLKKLLETKFSKKVDCTYCYSKTPIDYGCDLREIFYNRNNELIEGGQVLLDIFKQKKLPDIWHIMTDIDDTLYPNTETIKIINITTYIAGSDISWAQKTPYPGIITFYESFYKKLPINSKYTTILSATPGCLKNSKLNDSDNILHDILKNYGFIQGVEGKFEIASYTGRIITNMGSNLAGRALDKIDPFLPVNKYITRASSASVNDISNLFKLFGNTKFERFKQYLSIFPEYKILFIGDNGQGDVLAGMQMLEHNNQCHVFIHKVSENGRTFKVVPEETNNESERLNFFTNYYELSLKFKDLGIFEQSDVDQIGQSIVTKLKTSPYRQFIGLYTTIPGVTSGGKFTRKNNRKARKYALTRKIRKYKSTKKLKKQNYKTTKKLK